MSNRCYVIAEAGVNHNGSTELGLALVEAAAAAKADAVKFQTFRADELATADAPKAGYQKDTTEPGESQREMLQRLELSAEQHRALQARANALGIEFLSTPFSVASLDFLVEGLSLHRIKISSGDLTNAPLLVAAARTGLPLIVSTGMATLEEVGQALGALAFGDSRATGPPTDAVMDWGVVDADARRRLRQRVTLLHCTSRYPAQPDEINLRAMETLRAAYGLAVGFSDHSEGIVAPIAAVALGATVVEKHLTLDRSLPGPDHRASVEPQALADVVASIRAVTLMLGRPDKQPVDRERETAAVARKSLVAKRSIAAGELFSEENLAVKRPGTGVSGLRYFSFLGRTASRSYRPDELIEP